ncbi:MAG: hypothetical protein DRI36_03310 [Caldiserica bacterium]|nr:MAG: hypothetical protein DRI36_03310 [Caldisericota bacterium]
MLACPTKAISEGKREVGEMFLGKIKENLFFSYARMNVSEARATPLISYLEKNLKRDVDFIIFDSPPGASCPMVEVVKDADYVILVTEPTPFGLFDLKIAYEVVKEIGKKAGLVINKSGENDYIIEEFAEKEDIDVILKIPFSMEFAKEYSSGRITLEYFLDLEERILTLFKENGSV